MKRTSWLGPVCWLFGAALGMGLAMSTSATAGILIEGTRVIYLSNDREVTARVKNEGEIPSLVQVWLDDGNKSARPETTKVPFIVTPPLFRMEPKQGQSLRIIQTGEAMAQDKETIFWLNVLELPPKRPADFDDNSLQLAFRSRIKMFYRPVALNQPEAIDKARAGLQWKRTSGPDKTTVLEVSNASPYYITVVNISYVAGERTVDTTDGTMVSPGGTVTVVVPKEASALSDSAGFKVKYQSISDYGGLIPVESNVGK